MSRLLLSLFVVTVLGAGPFAAADEPADVDVAKLGIKPVPVTKDPKTGFLVGGKNPTALIATLKEINGRTIEELEKDMRPGALSKKFEGSRLGFLGPAEKLLKVLEDDNKYVVDELGLTHQELAKHLRIFGEIGRRADDGRDKGSSFTYQGRKFHVQVRRYKGVQDSPFFDGTKTDSDALVKNVSSGEEMKYSLLVPHMIERYGFYEGKGTPYRVEPSRVLEVFDFLKRKAKK